MGNVKQLWNLGLNVIQGQAGKPFYHAAGNDIVYPDMIEGLKDTDAVGEGAVTLNKCLCNFKKMHYYRCIAKLCDTSDSIVFIEKENKIDVQKTEKGYQWKFWSPTLNTVIEDELPLPSAIYEYIGCCLKRLDVGVWLPIESPEEGTVSCLKIRMAGTEKHTTYPSPYYYKTKATMGEWMLMIVSNYKCCGGEAGCGLVMKNEEGDPESPTKDTTAGLLYLLSFIKSQKGWEKEEPTTDNPLGYWQLYVCYEDPSKPGRWGKPVITKGEITGWLDNVWLAVGTLGAPSLKEIREDLLLNTLGLNPCIYDKDNIWDCTRLIIPQRFSVVHKGPVSGIATYYYKGIPRHPMQLTTMKPDKLYLNRMPPMPRSLVYYVNAGWLHTLPVNLTSSCYHLNGSTPSLVTAYMWTFNQASLLQTEMYLQGDTTAGGLEALPLSGITISHTCNFIAMYNDINLRFGEISPKGDAYYTDDNEDNPLPCNVPVLPQYKYKTLEELSTSSESSDSTVKKWACIGVPLYVFAAIGSLTLARALPLHLGSSTGSSVANALESARAYRTACFNGYDLGLTAGNSLYTSLYIKEDTWKPLRMEELDVSLGTDIEATLYTQQEYNNSLLKDIILNKHGIKGYIKSHSSVLAPSYNFGLSEDGTPGDDFAYLYYKAPVLKKDGKYEIKMEGLPTPLSMLPILIHRCSLQENGIGGYLTYYYYKLFGEGENISKAYPWAARMHAFYSGNANDYAVWDTSSVFVTADGSQPNADNLKKLYNPFDTEVHNTFFNICKDANCSVLDTPPSLPPMWKRLSLSGTSDFDEVTQFLTSVLDARFLSYSCDALRPCKIIDYPDYVPLFNPPLQNRYTTLLAACTAFHRGLDKEYDYVNLKADSLPERLYRVYRWLEFPFTVNQNTVLTGISEEAAMSLSKWLKVTRILDASLIISARIQKQLQDVNISPSTVYVGTSVSGGGIGGSSLTYELGELLQTGWYGVTLDSSTGEKTYTRLSVEGPDGKLLTGDNMVSGLYLPGTKKVNLIQKKKGVLNPSSWDDYLIFCDVVFVLADPAIIPVSNYVTSLKVALSDYCFLYKAKSICWQRFIASLLGTSAYQMKNLDYYPLRFPWVRQDNIAYVDLSSFIFRDNRALIADATDLSLEASLLILERCYLDNMIVLAIPVKADDDSDATANDLLCRVGPPADPPLNSNNIPQYDCQLLEDGFWDLASVKAEGRYWDKIKLHSKFGLMYNLFVNNAEVFLIGYEGSLPRVGLYLHWNNVVGSSLSPFSSYIGVKEWDPARASDFRISTTDYRQVRWQQYLLNAQEGSSCIAYLCMLFNSRQLLSLTVNTYYYLDYVPPEKTLEEELEGSLSSLSSLQPLPCVHTTILNMINEMNSSLAKDILNLLNISDYTFETVETEAGGSLTADQKRYILYRYFIGRGQSFVGDKADPHPILQVYFGNTCCGCEDWVSYADAMTEDLSCSVSFSMATLTVSAAIYRSDSIVDNVDKLHMMKYLYYPDASLEAITTDIGYTTDPIVLLNLNSCSQNTMIDFGYKEGITYYNVPDIKVGKEGNVGKNMLLYISDAMVVVLKQLGGLKKPAVTAKDGILNVTYKACDRILRSPYYKMLVGRQGPDPNRCQLLLTNKECSFITKQEELPTDPDLFLVDVTYEGITKTFLFTIVNSNPDAPVAGDGIATDGAGDTIIISYITDPSDLPEHADTHVNVQYFLLLITSDLHWSSYFYTLVFLDVAIEDVPNIHFCTVDWPSLIEINCRNQSTEEPSPISVKFEKSFKDDKWTTDTEGASLLLNSNNRWELKYKGNSYSSLNYSGNPWECKWPSNMIVEGSEEVIEKELKAATGTFIYTNGLYKIEKINDRWSLLYNDEIIYSACSDDFPWLCSWVGGRFNVVSILKEEIVYDLEPFYLTELFSKKDLCVWRSKDSDYVIEAFTFYGASNTYIGHRLIHNGNVISECRAKISPNGTWTNNHRVKVSYKLYTLKPSQSINGYICQDDPEFKIAATYNVGWHLTQYQKDSETVISETSAIKAVARLEESKWNASVVITRSATSSATLTADYKITSLLAEGKKRAWYYTGFGIYFSGNGWYINTPDTFLAIISNSDDPVSLSWIDHKVAYGSIIKCPLSETYNGHTFKLYTYKIYPDHYYIVRLFNSSNTELGSLKSIDYGYDDTLPAIEKCQWLSDFKTIENAVFNATTYKILYKLDNLLQTGIARSWTGVDDKNAYLRYDGNYWLLRYYNTANSAYSVDVFGHDIIDPWNVAGYDYVKKGEALSVPFALDNESALLTWKALYVNGKSEQHNIYLYKNAGGIWLLKLLSTVVTAIINRDYYAFWCKWPLYKGVKGEEGKGIVYTLLKVKDTTQTGLSRRWESLNIQLYSNTVTPPYTWLLNFKGTIYTGVSNNDSVPSCPPTFTWPLEVTLSFEPLDYDCSKIDCQYTKPDPEAGELLVSVKTFGVKVSYTGKGTVTATALTRLNSPSISRSLTGKIELQVKSLTLLDGTVILSDDSEYQEVILLDAVVSITTYGPDCQGADWNSISELEEACWGLLATLTVSRDNGDSTSTPYFTATKILPGVTPNANNAIIILFNAVKEVDKMTETSEGIISGDFTFPKESPLYDALEDAMQQGIFQEGTTPLYFYYKYIVKLFTVAEDSTEAEYVKNLPASINIFDKITLTINTPVQGDI